MCCSVQDCRLLPGWELGIDVCRGQTEIHRRDQVGHAKIYGYEMTERLRQVTKYTFATIASFLVLLTSCAPNLTPEQRRNDVGALARWARDYHACVEVNSKVAGMPDYEKLLPKYMDLAEQAESNEEFLHVVWGYFKLIGASGHGHLLPESGLLGYMIDSLRHKAKGLSDIPWRRFWEARYWARLHKKSFAHAPFQTICEGEKYLTDEDWSYWGKRIPKGSQIIAVNGMSCSQYKDHLVRETLLRYVATDGDPIPRQLFVINEGSGFRGWDVSFRLPDGSQCDRFVPGRKGWRPAYKSEFMNWRKGNCECVELSDEVGYVRIIFMIGGRERSDERKIRRFLDKSQGHYKKLIIDLRHNGGGSTIYTYDVLLRPFLDEPLVYKQTSGVKRKLLADFPPELVSVLVGSCSRYAWETDVEEVPPPEGFDPNVWIFHQISREVKPSNRYAFDGDLYVLMDQASASATETYLDAIKRTGFATLLGQRSAGAMGGYIIAPVMRLPESGMIFRMEADLDINPDGTFNELTGVRPDVELPSCPLPQLVDKEALLKDAWIQAIIDGPDM